LALAYAFTGFLIAFYLAWFPTYLAKDRHLDLTHLGSFSGISAAALCVGVLVAGRVLHRLTQSASSWRLARLPMGILSLLVAGLATVVLPRFQSDTHVLIAACVAMVALAFSQVVTWSTVQDIGGAATALITGIVSLFGNVAAGGAPVLSAILVERTGSWSASLFIIGAIVSIGSLSWFFVRPDRPIHPLPRHAAVAAE
jgi:MFS family permease